MTRNELAKQKAQEFASNDEYSPTLTECFIAGAKWADEHPNPDTVKKIFEVALNNTNFLIADSLQSIDFEVLVTYAIKKE
jgi:hypothetical protein